jgi:adenine phosphoribosyltransferase
VEIKQALALIKSIPNFPQDGIVFQDITPLLSHPEGFQSLIRALNTIDSTADSIVAIEARGFIIGAALAHSRSIGFIPVRKKGKLPRAVFQENYSLEYGDDCLEIHRDACAHNSRILLVDDVLATGGTINAAIKLIEQAGGTVKTVVVLIEISALGGRELILKHNPDISIETLLTI